MPWPASRSYEDQRPIAGENFPESNWEDDPWGAQQSWAVCNSWVGSGTRGYGRYVTSWASSADQTSCGGGGRDDRSFQTVISRPSRSYESSLQQREYGAAEKQRRAAERVHAAEAWREAAPAAMASETLHQLLDPTVGGAIAPGAQAQGTPEQMWNAVQVYHRGQKWKVTKSVWQDATWPQVQDKGSVAQLGEFTEELHQKAAAIQFASPAFEKDEDGALTNEGGLKICEAFLKALAEDLKATAWRAGFYTYVDDDSVKYDPLPPLPSPDYEANLEARIYGGEEKKQRAIERAKAATQLEKEATGTDVVSNVFATEAAATQQQLSARITQLETELADADAASKQAAGLFDTTQQRLSAVITELQSKLVEADEVQKNADGRITQLLTEAIMMDVTAKKQTSEIEALQQALSACAAEATATQQRLSERINQLERQAAENDAAAKEAASEAAATQQRLSARITQLETEAAELEPVSKEAAIQVVATHQRLSAHVVQLENQSTIADLEQVTDETAATQQHSSACRNELENEWAEAIARFIDRINQLESEAAERDAALRKAVSDAAAMQQRINQLESEATEAEAVSKEAASEADVVQQHLSARTAQTERELADVDAASKKTASEAASTQQRPTACIAELESDAAEVNAASPSVSIEAAATHDRLTARITQLETELAETFAVSKEAAREAAATQQHSNARITHLERELAEADEASKKAASEAAAMQHRLNARIIQLETEAAELESVSKEAAIQANATHQCFSARIVHLEKQVAIADLALRRAIGENAPIYRFYDFAMEILSFEHVYRHGWKTLIQADAADDQATQNCKRIAFIGRARCGKTWLLHKIAGSEQAETEVLYTPSLCWKYLRSNEAFTDRDSEERFLLIDSKGEQSPLSGLDGQLVTDIGAEQSFIREVLCGMSDAVIYMVNSVGYSEQCELNNCIAQLTRKVSSFIIIVVHNLSHLSRQDEFAQAKDEICSMYATKGFSVRQEETVEFLESSLCLDNSPATGRQIHVFLAKEHVESCHDNHLKHDNAGTISFIKKLLTSLPDAGNQFSLQASLCSVMSDAMPKYLDSQSSATKLEVRLQDGAYKLTGSEDGISLRSSGLVSSCRTLFEPAHVGYRVFESEDCSVRVEIDLPGYSQKQLLIDLAGSGISEQITYRVLSVEKSEAGVKIAVSPQRSVQHLAGRELGLEDADGEHAAAPNYPVITIQKPVSLENVIARYEHGTVLLSFSLDAADVCDPQDESSPQAIQGTASSSNFELPRDVSVMVEHKELTVVEETADLNTEVDEHLRAKVRDEAELPLAAFLRQEGQDHRKKFEPEHQQTRTHLHQLESLLTGKTKDKQGKLQKNEKSFIYMQASLEHSKKAEDEKSKLIKQLQSQLDAYDRERAR